MPAQSIPPIVIITLGVGGMGALQQGVNYIFQPSKVTCSTPTSSRERTKHRPR